MLRGLTLVADDRGGLIVQAVGGPLPGFQVTEWRLGETLALLSSVIMPGDGQAGATPAIESLSMPGGERISVMVGDGSGVARLLSRDASGALTAPTATGAAPAWPRFEALVLSEQAGSVFAYGLSAGQTQPEVWRIGSDGAPDPMVLSAAGASFGPGAISLALSGGHLAVAGGDGALISLYRIGADGQPIPEGQVAAADNPGMAGAIVLAAGEAGGTGHVIAGAAQSGTLSVWALGADGALRLTDHLLDSRDSRFQGVNLIESVTRDGSTWIAAGGADSGVSLFRLLPTGRLVQVARLADAIDWSLDGLAALDLMADEAGLLHLVTAGLRDGGLSHFSFAPATLVMGAGGNDRLTGTDASDIVVDGAGEDTLGAGAGAGADIFVLDSDGQTDVILGFDPTEDRLDLSNWPFFRGAHHLVITPRADGAELVFDGPLGRERLILQSASGEPLEDAALRAALLPGPDRLLLPDLVARMPEVPDNLRLEGTPAAGELMGQGGQDTIIGFAGSDVLRGEGGNDSIEGGKGFDTIFGGPGEDTLFGQDGWDSLFGGDGDDLLFGNNGSDTLIGEAGSDTLFGGVGGDLLQGGGGDDSLVGMSGPDVLEGASGVDHLQGNAGADTVIGGDQDDHLQGGLNFDLLDGGAGRDLLDGGNGADTLLGGPGNDTLRGNAGQDWLEGGGGTDLLDGGIGGDTFVFRGGNVTIERFQRNVDTLLFDTALFGADVPSLPELVSSAVPVGSDTVFDFGAEGSLTILGLNDADRIAATLDFL
jgi:Ca2+-binding RTX toxin-like protein